MTAIEKKQESNTLESSLESAPPNAWKLVNSLRDSGYSSYEALEDIVDNSLDAGATKICIDVVSAAGPRGGVGKIDENASIAIFDNGYGMDIAILKEALRYGSDTPHDTKNDKGVFGLGLKTAGTSIGRCIKVLTRIAGGEVLCGILDLDIIAQKNEFVVAYPEPSLADEQKFEYLMETHDADSGTLVEISKIDKCSQKDVKAFTKMLSGPKHLARTYRYLLDTKKIFVQGTEVEAYDPLYWDDDATERWTTGWLTLPVARKDGSTESLKLRIGQRHNANAGKVEGSQRGQGLIFNRSLREIAQTGPQGLWTQSNWTYGLFVEIMWQGIWADEDFGIEFSKTSVKMSQSMCDFLNDKIGHIIKTAVESNKKKATQKSKSSGALQEYLEKRAKKNSDLSHVLDIPQTSGPKPAVPGKLVQFATTGTRGGSRKANGGTIQKVKTNSFDWDFNYEHVNMGKSGPLFEADFGADNNECSINLNQQHPFVATAMNASDQIRDLSYNIIDAIAFAEGKIKDDAQLEVIEQVKQSIANNLKQFEVHKQGK
jgi:hypothetical protein